MNRHWHFVRYRCDLPQVEGWYHVIDKVGAEYKDYYDAEKKKFAINNNIKAWTECYEKENE